LVLPEELSRNGGGPRMRSALQGWTCALRGRGAQSTGSGSLLSLPLPDDEDDDSTNMLLIVPVGISSPNFLARRTRLYQNQTPCASLHS
jgi:hypothetical protein